VDVHFNQVKDDYITNPGKNTQIKKRVEAKPCTQKEFGKEKWEIEFYEAWKGFSIMCPDNAEDESFHL
jgi:hypothetical protein